METLKFLKLFLFSLFVLLTFDIIKNKLYYSPLLVVYILLFLDLLSFFLSDTDKKKSKARKEYVDLGDFDNKKIE